MFFFLLLGVCVGIQSGVLNPVPPAGTLSFLQTAKTNPLALIDMLQGADKDTLNSIIKLLHQLKDESIAEQKRLKGLLEDAKKDLDAARTLLQQLVGKETDARIVKNDMTKTLNIAEGKLTEVQREHDETSPGLKNEIDIFQKVLNILNGLLSGQPQQKALIELGASAESRQYQKLIDNAKADPEKLKKIIDLIVKLLTQSKKALSELDTKLREATAERDAALDDKTKADGVFSQTQAAVNAQEAVVSEAKGAYDQAKKEFDTRHPEVTSERELLEKVIRILEQMLADQEENN